MVDVDQSDWGLPFIIFRLQGGGGQLTGNSNISFNWYPVLLDTLKCWSISKLKWSCVVLCVSAGRPLSSLLDKWHLKRAKTATLFWLLTSQLSLASKSIKWVLRIGKTTNEWRFNEGAKTNWCLPNANNDPFDCINHPVLIYSFVFSCLFLFCVVLSIILCKDLFSSFNRSFRDTPCVLSFCFFPWPFARKCCSLTTPTPIERIIRTLPNKQHNEQVDLAKVQTLLIDWEREWEREQHKVKHCTDKHVHTHPAHINAAAIMAYCPFLPIWLLFFF